MSGETDSQLEIATKSNYWLHTARPVKVAGVNAFAVVPGLIWLFYMHWWVFYTWIGTIVVLAILERFQYTPLIAFRLIRGFLAGKTTARVRRVGHRRIWK